MPRGRLSTLSECAVWDETGYWVSVLYLVSTSWWSAYLGRQPYFDQPFYVGFDVGGYELGLTPTDSQPAGPVTYFGVDDIQVAVAKAIKIGASVEEEISDVGDGIIVPSLRSPRGERFGLILNPNFRAKN